MSVERYARLPDSHLMNRGANYRVHPTLSGRINGGIQRGNGCATRRCRHLSNVKRLVQAMHRYKRWTIIFAVDVG